MTRDVNGVFDGGGAKGIAYVGALRACEDADLRFRAVAGSSAGAITAALVACGCRADTIESLMPAALGCLGRPDASLLRLTRRSLLSSERLRAWLATTLGAQLAAGGKAAPAGASPTDPTFDDVRRGTGVALYVVVMDLGARRPLVFSPDLTPTASVADAVVASAAIPVAFPSQRVVVEGEVRRLADGGVWANYPSFVFFDADFRACFGLDVAERARPTIGFVLDPPETSLASVHPDLSTLTRAVGAPLLSDHGSAARELGIAGGLITSPAARVAAVVLPLFLAVLGVQWFQFQLDESFPAVRWMSAPGLQELALLTMVALFALLLAVVVVVAFLVVRLGRVVVDEGIVGVSAAMGVGPNVPGWVGAVPMAVDGGEPAHVVVRIPVPARLTTLRFTADDALRAEAVRAGHDAAARSLGAAGLSPASGSAPAPEPAPSTPPVPLRRSRMQGASGIVVSGAVFYGWVVAAVWLSRRVLRDAWAQQMPWWPLLALVVAACAIVVVHGKRRHERALAPSTFLRDRRPLVLAAIGLASSVVAVVGLLLATRTSNELTVLERVQSSGFTGVATDVRRVDDAARAAGEPPFADVVELEAASVPSDVVAPDVPVLACAASNVAGCVAFATDASAWADDLGTRQMFFVGGRDIVLPETARWDYSYRDILYLPLTVPFVVLPIRCWSAFRYRRQRSRQAWAPTL